MFYLASYNMCVEERYIKTIIWGFCTKILTNSDKSKSNFNKFGICIQMRKGKITEDLVYGHFAN